MYTFESQDRYTITGRGPVFVVANPHDHTKPRMGSAWPHLLSQIVEIDGQQYRVKGVESYCVVHIPEGSPIGLLVEPLESVS